MLLRAINKVIRPLNYEIRKKPSLNDGNFPPDFDDFEKDLLKKCRPYTLTSPERLVSLSRSVKYIVENQIPGDFVECGVWKGGSVMAMLLTLNHLGDQTRNCLLYDTYEGMSEPTEDDISHAGQSAIQTIESEVKLTKVDLDLVQKNVSQISYPKNQIEFIQGKVEDTIPDRISEQIALLRLDTDWYESTLHELNHLYPRLVSGGVLIIDDYGHWMGARKATDEYISEKKIPILLNRVDYTGRVAVKR